MMRISLPGLCLVIFTQPVSCQDEESWPLATQQNDTTTTETKQPVEAVKKIFGRFFGGGDKEDTRQQTSEQATVDQSPPVATDADGKALKTSTVTTSEAAALSGRDQVRAIQAKLNAMGYDAGPEDGRMGKRTRNAIKEYQRNTGQPVDGKPSASLLQSFSGAVEGKTAEFASLADGSAAEQEANDYEGALQDDDYVCEDMVDEFEYSSNIIKVLKIGAEKTGAWFTGMFDGGKKDLSKTDTDGLKSILEETRLTAKRTNWMPLSVEQRYGKLVHERRLEQSPEVISRRVKGRKARQYKKADAILAELLEQIPEEYPYEFKLFLTDDADANAEAVPGGYLYLSTGALDKGVTHLVLGHEIAHVTKRHTTRELQARLIDSVATVDDIKELMADKDPDSEAMLKRVAALSGRFLNYSRQQELQADACAISLAGGLPNLDITMELDRYIGQISATQSQQDLRTSQHPGYPQRRERMGYAMRHRHGQHGKKQKNAHLSEHAGPGGMMPSR